MTSPAVARWPASVRVALARAGEGMAVGASGRVLDLGEPAARAVVQDAVRAARRAEPRPGPDERYDLVLSVADLVDHADLFGTLRGIVHVLADDGEVRFVEPSAEPGLAALAAASLASAHPAVRGCHLHRDVPGTVRAAGLDIAALDHRHVATAVWPLRRLARGRAVHTLRLDDGDGAARSGAARNGGSP